MITACENPGCCFPATIHFNGGHYCSPACHARVRQIEQSARLQLAERRDAALARRASQGEIGALWGGALVALVLAYGLCGGYQTQKEMSTKWQGQKLVARGGVR
jgi:type VI protein secretion system component VasF